MPIYGKVSKLNLATCHPLLQAIFLRVIKKHDCSIIEGHRTEERQNELHKLGRSKVRWPDSNHNKIPAMAIDAAPFIAGRIPWPEPGTKTYIKDLNQFYYFSGLVMSEAENVLCYTEWELRWGGDWDRDHNLSNNKFDDLPHFELVKRRK
ncbi:MAG: M15 family metallopeptidase [Candidatus Peribacteraceae bacterium]|nr:M15 family metallopeptidase [Candidatus Peribacteraceae bacterium]